jgi:gliding motility-associated-like protein
MSALNAFGQNFNNADLEGTVGMSSTPQSWYTVSYSDVTCLAYSNMTATPDLTGTQGPIPAIGISGIPQSGNTFISGLISESTGTFHHEGIRQTVTGFVPGKSYTISFYQTVVKQNNQLDPSGSWAVYIDTTLAGISSPSNSSLTFDNQSLQWEERSVSFDATNSTHSIKFLPMDDDNSQAVPYEGLRMGIDQLKLTPDSSHIFHDTICVGELATVWASGADQYYWVPLNDTSNVLSYDSTLTISPDSTAHYLCINNLDTNLATVTVLHPPTLDLGVDHYLCQGDTALIIPEVYNASRHLWNDGSSGFNLITHVGGMHWMIAENTCGTVTDSVGIHIDSIQSVDYSSTSTECSHDPILLNIPYPGAQIEWNDGSSDTQLFADQSGTYWAEISNQCGSSIHEFNIEYVHCSALLEMPNVFSPNGDGVNEFYVPIHQEHITDYYLIILNRWGEVIFESTDIVLGWNGLIQGQPASEGVYFWQVNYSNPSEDNIRQQGSLTLVR